MWLNERVMEAASDTFSHNADIRQMQVEAWEDYMQNGDSSALIDAGLQRIKQAIRNLYKPGDLITSFSPDDPCDALIYLLIREEDNGDWVALCEGELQTLPLRFWLVEDHQTLCAIPE
jgi:hypothetical protein